MCVPFDAWVKVCIPSDGDTIDCIYWANVIVPVVRVTVLLTLAAASTLLLSFCVFVLAPRVSPEWLLRVFVLDRAKDDETIS